MKNCGCHCCRRFCECDGERHSEKDLIWAWYYDYGKYYWVKDGRPKGGVRVKICVWCRDFLSEEPWPKAVEEAS